MKGPKLNAEEDLFRGKMRGIIIVAAREKEFEVGFAGSFCRTCGFYDYFDDLGILLEDGGLAAGIAEAKENDGDAAVRFQIR